MDEHSLETLELELAILIRRYTSVSTYKKIGNLDRSAYLLLHYLTSHGPAGVKALAEAFRLDISTVSRQAAALEQKGYVLRIPDPLDRRAYFLQITALGTKEFIENKNARINKISSMLEDWTDDERKIFGELLRKYNHSANQLQT